METKFLPMKRVYFESQTCVRKGLTSVFFNFIQSYFLASGKQFHVAFAALTFIVFPRLSLGLFASAKIIKVYASLFQVPR